MNMNGYFLVDAATDTTITANGQYLLEQREFTEQEAKLAVQATAIWIITYSTEWICCARSDNGIDARKMENHLPLPVCTEWMVLRDGKAVGVFTESHLFLFEDPATHFYANRRDCGYVGGWGDIEEIDYFRLEKQILG